MSNNIAGLPNTNETTTDMYNRLLALRKKIAQLEDEAYWLHRQITYSQQKVYTSNAKREVMFD